jgi:hypothetical protein
MTELITGLFRNRTSAEQAVTDLKNLGYQPNEVSVIMHDKTRARDFADVTGTEAAAGTGWGAGIGGVLGFLIGLGAVGTTVATGGLAAPFIAGPLAAAWAGAGIGGLSGGIIGWLVGLGIPEERARTYETGLNEGGILLAVNIREQDEVRVRDTLVRDGAEDVEGGRMPVSSTYATAGAGVNPNTPVGTAPNAPLGTTTTTPR